MKCQMLSTFLAIGFIVVLSTISIIKSHTESKRIKEELARSQIKKKMQKNISTQTVSKNEGEEITVLKNLDALTNVSNSLLDNLTDVQSESENVSDLKNKPNLTNVELNKDEKFDQDLTYENTNIENDKIISEKTNNSVVFDNKSQKPASSSDFIEEYSDSEKTSGFKILSRDRLLNDLDDEKLEYIYVWSDSTEIENVQK